MPSFKFILVIAGLFISVLCSAQAASDSLAIIELIKADYLALGKDDTVTIRKHCTSDYLLIENGEIWDLSKEIEHIRSMKNKPATRIDKFIYHKVSTEGKSGYAVYELESSITRAGVTNNYKWTESAILKKEKGGWKIQLIHSTKVKQW